MIGPKQKIDVTCPRCGETVGTVMGWVEVTFDSEYDEKTKTDKGSVYIEVKVSERGHREGAYAGSSKRIEHNCEGRKTSDDHSV